MLKETANRLTLEGRGEAEDVEEAPPVLQSITPEPCRVVGAATRLSGFGDGVAHRAVTQPAGVAPVQAASPGLYQLVVTGDHSILLKTRLRGVGEVQVVAARRWRVGKDDT